MAASSHVRSISWPDNVHPLTRTIEYHLLTLTTTTTTQLPQSSMYKKLGVLKNLYEVVEDFLRLPLTREPPTDLELVSDGFLQVLDICSTARDVILQTKEQIRDLESAIRRRSKSGGGGGGGGEKELAREIDAFVSRRRAMNRTVSRYARPQGAMKRTEKKGRCSRKDVLREVHEVSFGVLFGLLMILSAGSDQKQRWRRKNWNIVISKMFPGSKSSNASESEVLGVTEEELEGMKKSGNGVVCGEELQRLREMEMKVEEIEGELEIVYRKLVKTRVSLLNILNSNI